MTGERFQEEYEVPISRRHRRELRRKRWWEKWRWRKQRWVEEYEVPKTRRRRRELRRERRQRKWRVGFREFLFTILIAAVVVFGFIRPFVMEAYRIPSESMVPTLEVGDRILANKFIYRFTKPKRGDIVIFDGVEGEEDQTLIKRVVGVAGDKIQVQNGTLFVNDEAQDEPYLNKKSPSQGSYGPTKVPQRHVFVMGDNRGNSADSRIFGPVALENVRGEAFLRFWPITEIGPLNL